MDRNQIIGIVLIAAIIIGFMIMNKPSEEELKKQQQIKDSIALVQQQQEELYLQDIKKQDSAKINSDTSVLELADQILTKDTLTSSDSLLLDSLNLKLEDLYGDFSEASIGEEKFYTLENDLMKIKILNKGGRIYSVELKEFVTHDSLPLILFDGYENTFKLDFFAENKLISTDNFYFEPSTENQTDSANYNLALRLNAGDDQYLEYSYKLTDGSYIVDYVIKLNNLDQLIGKNSSFLDLTWENNVPFLERGDKWENQNTGLSYKYYQDDVEELNLRKDTEEKVPTKISWVAFKQQFFSSIIIAKNSFESAEVKHKDIMAEGNGILKVMTSNLTLPYKGEKDEIIPLAFYFGPNKYKILKNINFDEDNKLKLQELIPLGNSVFRWVNIYALIPLFNFLGKYVTNYGLLILLMTIIIKLVLFPLTYKSYQSSAKMRVLKPQIDDITAKIPADKAVERQQATMSLYKKAGVNPMGGCIPVLLQFPILIAMFRFFPASIELRQKSFLWATDLSSYDSIFSWEGTIPLITNIYGNHVSLFTILMAAAIIVSTILSGNQMQTAGNPQMASMKYMMYLMPVVMIFWFNNYSAGLSYYYLLSNVITIIQTLVMRKFVNEDDLLHKLNTNVKKNKEQPKKSGFQQRLEEMAKQKGINPPKR